MPTQSREGATQWKTNRTSAIAHVHRADLAPILFTKKENLRKMTIPFWTITKTNGSSRNKKREWYHCSWITNFRLPRGQIFSAGLERGKIVYKWPNNSRKEKGGGSRRKRETRNVDKYSNNWSVTIDIVSRICCFISFRLQVFGRTSRGFGAFTLLFNHPLVSRHELLASLS